MAPNIGSCTEIEILIDNHPLQKMQKGKKKAIVSNLESLIMRNCLQVGRLGFPKNGVHFRKI